MYPVPAEHTPTNRDILAIVGLENVVVGEMLIRFAIPVIEVVHFVNPRLLNQAERLRGADDPAVLNVVHAVLYVGDLYTLKSEIAAVNTKTPGSSPVVSGPGT